MDDRELRQWVQKNRTGIGIAAVIFFLLVPIIGPLISFGLIYLLNKYKGGPKVTVVDDANSFFKNLQKDAKFSNPMKDLNVSSKMRHNLFSITIYGIIILVAVIFFVRENFGPVN